MTDDLIAFLRARLNEEEAAAKAAGGERWSVGGDADDAVVPADRGGNSWIAVGPWGGMDRADAAHIAHHDPARALREVAADRALLDQYDRLLRQRAAHEKALAEWNADVEHEGRTGKWEGAGDPGTRSRALGREGDYLGAMEPVLHLLIAAKAAVWSDHPDYRQEWAVS